MSNDFNDLLSEITPTLDEKLCLENKKNKLQNVICDSFSKFNTKVKFKSIGSAATGTYLRGYKDIDCFAGLQSENIDLFLKGVTNIQKQISFKINQGITKAKANFIFDDYTISLAFIKVPIKNIETLDQDAYFHPDFTLARLSNTQIKDVLLTKTFFKCLGIYGTKICGFACEQIVINFESFESFLKKISGNESICIDFSGKYANSEAPIIVSYPYTGLGNLCHKVTLEDRCAMTQLAKKIISEPATLKKIYKKEKNLIFWKERSSKYGLDERLSTPDVFLNEREINLLAKILFKFEGSKILDAGCGNGHTLLTLAQRAGHHIYLGIDISPDVIDYASQLRSNYPKKVQNIVSFAKGSLTNLPLNDNSLDVIITKRALINLPDKEEQIKAIQEIYRVLNKKGYYFMLESFVKPFDSINKLRTKFNLAYIPKFTHASLLDEKILADSSFETISMHDFSSTYFFLSRIIYPKICKNPNSESLVNYISSKLPSIGNFGLNKLYVLRKN